MIKTPRNTFGDRDISKAQLEAAGWNLDQFERSSPFECHMVYTYDFRYQSLNLFSYPIVEFSERAVRFEAKDLAVKVEMLLKKNNRKKLSRKERHELPAAIAEYVKSTRTYQLWLSEKSVDDRMHAFVCIYGGKGIPAAVRPSIFYDRRPVVPVDEAKHYAESQYAMDLRSHPEWFRA